MSTCQLPAPGTRIAQGGFSLVELMIALVLGLLVIGGVTTVFLSNKQSYRSNQGLSEIQENSRIAFELMARDLRQAGLTGCGNVGRVANVLNNGPSGASTLAWWADFSNNAIHGYEGGADDPALTEGGASGNRVSTTDSLQIIGASPVGFSIASDDAAGGTMTLNESTTDLVNGDVLVVCDPDHAAIVQLSADPSGTPLGLTINSTTGSPGNCSIGLGFPTQCTTANSYAFAANSQIAKLNAIDWYVGNNPVGGKSLYRLTLVTSAGVPTPTTQEMIRNVLDMQILYHRNGQATFDDTATDVGAGNWSSVDAVRLNLTFQTSQPGASTGSTTLRRTVGTTIALRNRVN